MQVKCYEIAYGFEWQSTVNRLKNKKNVIEK